MNVLVLILKEVWMYLIFALKNKIKLIYSATSASLWNNGHDMNLSPYAFSKSKNLELLENFKRWFNFWYEVVYFYNVYGEKQICKGDMATVVGIFEDHFKNRKKLPVVRPGAQVRRFAHIYDTVKACIFAWKKTNANTILLQANNLIALLNLQNFLGIKLDICQEEQASVIILL